MRYCRNFLCAVAACLALASGPASAWDAVDDDVWVRATSDDGTYSVELPCGAEEVLTHSTAMALSRAALGGGTLACLRGGTLFSVQMVSAADDEPLPSPIFDMLIEGLRAETLDDGVVLTETSLAGHRAVITEEIESDAMARTGIVELSDRSYLFMMSGAIPNQGSVPADFAEQVERFFSSMEIVSR